MAISKRKPVQGEFSAPASKPQTQRAVIAASLAEGLTTIHRPLVARETLIMIEACRSLGAEISLAGDRLEIRGIGPEIGSSLPMAGKAADRYIWAGGSALVARLFIAITSALPDNFIIDGKCNLRGRPFEPLTTALRNKGIEFRFPDERDRLPCAVISSALPGGHYQLSTDVSSQFATSLLISAPLAAGPLSIDLVYPNYSISYIRQTIEMMSVFGVAVEAADGLSQISVLASQGYQAQNIELTGDYTSASYILAAAFITRGSILLSNLDPSDLQGEKAIVGMLAELGAAVRWIQDENTVLVDCTNRPDAVDAIFDLSDSPNILPTVAAVAATIPGRVRIVGGRLTQNHKSRRIEAVAEELGKAGVLIEILTDREGFVDGLDIRGKDRYPGDVEFSSHGDHRIAMAAMLFSLACRATCSMSDVFDTADSFPEFAEYLGLDRQLALKKPAPAGPYLDSVLDHQ